MFCSSIDDFDELVLVVMVLKFLDAYAFQCLRVFGFLANVFKYFLLFVGILEDIIKFVVEICL